MKKGRSFMGFELISMEEEEGFKGFFVGFGLKVKFFFFVSANEERERLSEVRRVERSSQGLD